MGVIAKEPQTFKKMFGNQTGYYSLMKPLMVESSCYLIEIDFNNIKQTDLMKMGK